MGQGYEGLEESYERAMRERRGEGHERELGKDYRTRLEESGERGQRVSCEKESSR